MQNKAIQLQTRITYVEPASSWRQAAGEQEPQTLLSASAFLALVWSDSDFDHAHHPWQHLVKRELCILWVCICLCVYLFVCLFLSAGVCAAFAHVSLDDSERMSAAAAAAAAASEEPEWLTEVFSIFRHARKRDYLVLDEVLQIQPSRENPIELAHLGILLVLDKHRNGRFYRSELIEFHKGYVSEASAHRNLDWQAQFQVLRCASASFFFLRCTFFATLCSTGPFILFYFFAIFLNRFLHETLRFVSVVPFIMWIWLLQDGCCKIVSQVEFFICLCVK